MSTTLAALAGATKLTGEVAITDADGRTTIYADEEAALADWEGRTGRLVHRRGAFFERPKLAESVEAVKEPAEAVEEDTRPRKRSSRRKRSS